MKDTKKAKELTENEVAVLMAEYNKQVNNSDRHSYSETTHNDDGGCCCCDCVECGCDTFACCSGI